MNKSIRLLKIVCLGVIFCASLPGCASQEIVRSQMPNPTAASNNPGMVYALPKGQIQLVATRKKIDDDDIAAAQKVATEAKATLEADKKALAEAEAASKTADALLKSATNAKDTTAATKEELGKKAALAAAVRTYLTEKAGASQKVAAAAAARATELGGIKGKWQEVVEVSALPVVPDASRRFIAHLNHEITRDDKLKITVANGMLSTGNATSTDQTTAVILSLVQAAAAFTGPGNLGVVKHSTLMFAKPFERPSEAPTPDKCTAYSLSAVFDPTNFAEVQSALSLLKRKTGAVVVKVDDMYCATSGSKCDIAGTVVPVVRFADKTSPAGLVYRAPRAVRITVGAASNFDVVNDTGCDASGSVPNATTVVVVPDSHAEFLMSARAGAFTKSTFDFAFKDGMPTDLSVEQPSEFLGIASLPIDLAKAILSVPASIIKLRVDYDSQANAEITAQTAAFNAQIARLSAQQALDAATKAAQ